MELLMALLPALIMIILVLVTRKVLVSLGVGIILASLIHADYNVVNALSYMWESFVGIISSFDWYLPILGFVIIIGGITSVLTLIGGVHAFADWAVSKVKSRIWAQIIAWFLGIVICIDDYFNALVIGEVSKPITDQYKVSRAKLAYIIDSTSAPVVILMPISTWGAYIIGIMGDLFSKAGYDTHTGFSGFVAAIPYQFYAIIAIIMVYAVIRYNINIGAMKVYEESSLKGNDESRLIVSNKTSEINIEGQNATQWTLIVPIIVLVLFTFIKLLIDADYNVNLLMEQSITVPLLFGGVTAFITTVIFALNDQNVKPISITKVIASGMFGMFKSAVIILVLAWMVSGAIQDLGTGELIASYISETNLSAALLPLILFLIAGGMAFATGTSWGSFGILLPIAVPIAVSTDPGLMPAMVASVLGGAVFGDHCSPVSDTTVLSATGARSTLQAHFISQVPYSLITAGIASAGYLIYGFTEFLLLSYLGMASVLFLFIQYMKKD